VSDTEEFSSPATAVVMGNDVVIRVGAFDYTFERTPHDTLIYKSRYPATPVEDDDEETFDPAKYR
jgi:hypothetical protein